MRGKIKFRIYLAAFIFFAACAAALSASPVLFHAAAYAATAYVPGNIILTTDFTYDGSEHELTRAHFTYLSSGIPIPLPAGITIVPHEEYAGDTPSTISYTKGVNVTTYSCFLKLTDDNDTFVGEGGKRYYKMDWRIKPRTLIATPIAVVRPYDGNPLVFDKYTTPKAATADAPFKDFTIPAAGSPGGAVSGETPSFLGGLTVNLPATMNLSDAKDAGIYDITTAATIELGMLRLADNGTFKMENYDLTVSTGVKYEITKREIEVTNGAAATFDNAPTKVYDGAVTKTVGVEFLKHTNGGGSESGIVSSDSVGVECVFDSKNAGAVVAGSYRLTGNTDAVKNYKFLNGNNADGGLTKRFTGGSITPKPLSDISKNPRKTYDATTTIDSRSVLAEGTITGDVLTLTGNFRTASAGTGKKGTYVLGGGDAGNYALVSYSDADGAYHFDAGEIARRSVNVNSEYVPSKVYDGAASFSIGSMNFTGVLPGESVTVIATFTTGASPQNAGNDKSGTYSLSGLGSGNYKFGDGQSASFTGGSIGYALITLLTSGSEYENGKPVKTYDGGLNFPSESSGLIAGTHFTGAVGDEAVTLTAAFDDKNAGGGKRLTFTLPSANGVNINYTLQNGSDVKSYSVNDGTIRKKSVTVTSGAPSKVYDGSKTVTVSDITYNGFLGSDGGSYVVGEYDTKDAGTGKSGRYALSGDGSGNYELSNPAFGDGIISKKTVTITGSPSKEYDGKSNTPADGITVSGFVAGEIVSVYGDYGSKNVGNYNNIAYYLSGEEAVTKNYLIPTGAYTGSITAASLTVAAKNRETSYGGQISIPSATLGAEHLDFSGFKNGETSSEALNGAFTLTLLNGTAEISTPISSLGVGTYYIKLEIGTATAKNGNYVIAVSTANGTLTIIRASQPGRVISRISSVANGANYPNNAVYCDEETEFVLSATGGVAGTYVFSITEGGNLGYVEEQSGGTWKLFVAKPGKITIKATRAESDNYYALNEFEPMTVTSKLRGCDEAEEAVRWIEKLRAEDYSAQSYYDVESMGRRYGEAATDYYDTFVAGGDVTVAKAKLNLIKEYFAEAKRDLAPDTSALEEIVREGNVALASRTGKSADILREALEDAQKVLQDVADKRKTADGYPAVKQSDVAKQYEKVRKAISPPKTIDPVWIIVIAVILSLGLNALWFFLKRHNASANSTKKPIFG